EQKLGLAEDSALRRIRAARVAREFPAIFPAIAEGRLHLTAVLLLKPWLRRENARDLIAAANRKSKAEIERLLAERSPQTESLPLVTALPGSSRGFEVDPEPVN